MTRTRTRIRTGRRTGTSTSTGVGTSTGAGRRARPLSAAVMAPLALLAVLALQGCDADQDPGTAPADSAPPSPTVPAEQPPQEPAGGPSEPAQSPAAVEDPCAVVSQEEAEKLADSKLNPGKRLAESCTYTGLANGPTAQVEIFIDDMARNYLDAERGSGHELSPLAEVGEEAYLEDGSVFFRPSEQWISIRVVRLVPPEQTRKSLEDLARTVADRL